MTRRERKRERKRKRERGKDKKELGWRCCKRWGGNLGDHLLKRLTKPWRF